MKTLFVETFSGKYLSSHFASKMTSAGEAFVSSPTEMAFLYYMSSASNCSDPYPNTVGKLAQFQSFLSSIAEISGGNPVLTDDLYRYTTKFARSVSNDGKAVAVLIPWVAAPRSIASQYRPENIYDDSLYGTGSLSPAYHNLLYLGKLVDDAALFSNTTVVSSCEKIITSAESTLVIAPQSPSNPLVVTAHGYSGIKDVLYLTRLKRIASTASPKFISTDLIPLEIFFGITNDSPFGPNNNRNVLLSAIAEKNDKGQVVQVNQLGKKIKKANGTSSIRLLIPDNK